MINLGLPIVLDLPRGTVSQTSYTVLLTLIYLNAVSKLYSSREHIVTNFISAPGRFCKWRYTNLYYYYYYYYSCTTISLSIR